jgi:dihydrofolate reductase
VNPVTLNIIVAMTASRVIGRDGRMPWHLPEDLKLFRTLTTGNTVIMGRKTYQSMGRPLPRRNNIIVSSTLGPVPGAEVCADLASALRAAETLGRPAYFMGGSGIYREALPLAEFLHVSWVESDYDGDTRFPRFDLSRWREVEQRRHPGFRYVLYQRISEDK